MSNPFFSVIIPAYNRPALLAMTLRSLASQEFTDFEAFIIDDCSTDSTPDVGRAFCDRYGWHFMRMEKNSGQARCRNAAIARARGNYITFLDADDLWLPRRLTVFNNVATTDHAAGFIFSNGYILQNERICARFFDPARKLPTGKIPPYMAISDYWLPYVTTNVALKKEVFDTCGTFREDMSHLEDMEFYVRVLEKYSVACIHTPVSVYRIHPATASPLSLTLKWDKGIEDFETTLVTAKPPADIERELRERIYRKQAIIYVKNLDGDKARGYFTKLSRHTLSDRFWLALSHAPVMILKLFRWAYGTARKLRPGATLPFDRTGVEDFVRKVGL